MKSFIQLTYKTVTLLKITTDMERDKKLQRLSNLVEVVEKESQTKNLLVIVKEIVSDPNDR